MKSPTLSLELATLNSEQHLCRRTIIVRRRWPKPRSSSITHPGPTPASQAAVHNRESRVNPDRTRLVTCDPLVRLGPSFEPRVLQSSLALPVPSRPTQESSRCGDSDARSALAAVSPWPAATAAPGPLCHGIRVRDALARRAAQSASRTGPFHRRHSDLREADSAHDESRIFFWKACYIHQSRKTASRTRH